MTPVRIVAALLLLVLASACSTEDSETPMDTPPAPLRVATYNGGLAKGFVRYTEERAPLTIAAAAALDVDVLCVQEFWRPEDVTALKAAAATSLPNQLFLEPDPGSGGTSGPPCTDAELDPLQACAEVACVGVPTDGLAGCIIANCNPEFSATSSDCSSCLAANIGGSFSDIRFTCTNSASGGYAYGGAFGTGLLTSATVKEQDSHVFTSSYNRRAVLYNKLDTSLGELNVFCTHLSAVFSNIPHPDAANGGTWEAEQAQQIQDFFAFATEKAAGGPILFLGDLNTGPALAGISGEAPANFALFAPAGYESEYVTQQPAVCTFCADNLLIGGGDDSTSVIIDHIFTKDFPVDVTTERILTESVALTVAGAPVTANLSDHYGLRATLSAP